jgi:cell division protein FtsB
MTTDTERLIAALRAMQAERDYTDGTNEVLRGENQRLEARAEALTAQVEKMRGALWEADLQLACLDDRHPTGTTPAIRARIRAALAAIRGEKA